MLKKDQIKQKIRYIFNVFVKILIK